jgi:sialidase-1
MPIPNPIGRIVNLLYVDYVEFSRATDLSIYLNDFESFGGPLSAIGMPDKTSRVLGVSTIGSLLENGWGHAYRRLNYGPAAAEQGLANALGAISAVEASSRSHIFAISNGQHLLHTYWTGSAWSMWEDLGDTNAFGGLAGISATAVDDSILIFGLSNRLELVYRVFPGQDGWKILGAAQKGGGLWGLLSAVTNPDGSAGIFTISQNRTLLVGLLANDGWKGWQELGPAALGGGLNGGVAALRDGNSTHIFATSENNRLLRKLWDGVKWSDWDDLGAPEQTGDLYPHVVAIKGRNPIEVFVVSKKGRLLHKGWGGKDWLDWEVAG